MKFKLGMIATFVTVTTNMVLPVQAQQSYSYWDCYLSRQDSQKVGNVSIWWGHTSGDGAWACNNWVPTCGNNGGCYAYQTGRQ